VTRWPGPAPNPLSPPIPVPLPLHGVRVPLLPHQRGRYVRDLRRDAAEQLPGVALQPNLPLHLHQPLHLHGPQPLHRPHHRLLRDHQGEAVLKRIFMVWGGFSGGGGIQLPLSPRSTSARAKRPSPSSMPTSPSARTAPNRASTVATAPRPAPSSAAASGERAVPVPGGDTGLLASGSGLGTLYNPPITYPAPSRVPGEESLRLFSPLAPRTWLIPRGS